MPPKSRTESLTVLQASPGLVLRDEEGREHRLSALETALWRGADGTREIDALVEAAQAVEPEVDRQRVWEALDALTDAGLMAEAAAPPTTVAFGRRSLLKGAFALGAGAAAVAATSTALAKKGDDDGKEMKEKATYEEQTRKQLCSPAQDYKLNEQKQKHELNATDEAAVKKDLASADEKEVKADPVLAKKIQERHLKADRERNYKRQDTREASHKAATKGSLKTSFGTGVAPAWIDLPNGATLEGVVQLETVDQTVDAAAGTCDTVLTVSFSSLGQGTSVQKLYAPLKEAVYNPKNPDPSASLVAVQFGHDGEFAFQGTLLGYDAAITAFGDDSSATTVKADVRVRFADQGQ